MIPNTITVTIDSTPITFTMKSQVGSTFTYVAPSVAGDLDGRPTLVVKGEKLKSGILRRSIAVRVPVAVDGKYIRFRSYSFTSNTPGVETIADVTKDIEMVLKLGLEIKASLANGDV